MELDSVRWAASEQYELALEAGGAGTWLWDRRTGEVQWDAALEAMYGLPAGTFGGTTDDWIAKVHPEDRSSVLERVHATLQGGEPHYLLYRTIRPDGAQRWIEARGRVVHDDDGEALGMVGVCHDVTERQQARERLEFLAEAGDLLGSSLDLDTTLQQLAKLVVPRLSDWCAVDLVDRGQLRTVAVAHVDPTKVERVRAVRERYGYSRQHGPAKVARTGQIEHLPEIDEDVLRAVAHDDEHLELLTDLGLRSAVVVPLRGHRQILGALTLIHAESGRQHTADDVALARDLAQRAAIAIDHARLFQERSRVAEMLQQALLPQELPEIPGVEVATSYTTAAATDIGGDFYDVIPSNGGWMVILGDVCGKGPEAASLTSLARHTVRAAARRTHDPGEVLGELNQALLEHEGTERYCTAVCAHLVVTDDGVELEVAAGGHPPPLVLAADGTVTEAACSGTLIGLFDDLDLTTARVTLGPGELLLLYTDGLVEARQRDELFGPSGARRTLAEAAGRKAGEVLDHVREAVEAFRDRQDDDMAMVALRAEP